MAGVVGVFFAFFGSIFILCVMKGLQLVLRVCGVGQPASTAKSDRQKKKLLLLHSPGHRQMGDLEAAEQHRWQDKPQHWREKQQ
jgi:hypothetical protein